nr:9232_t:CDS:2 [Entrophospora candida]
MFVFSLTKSFKRLPTGGSCISNTPSNGYVARYTTQKSFFNRKQELVKFKNAFSAPDPKLHVVLGPPSSGKTALIHERHMKFLTKMLQQGETSAVTDDLQLKFKPFGEGPFNEKEPTCDFKKGKSSSQFNSELACGEYETGEPLPCYLSKEDAEEYFEMSVLHKYECKELRGKFDHIRRITGTRMLIIDIIDMYVAEYKIYEGKLKEYGKLIRGLYPESLKSPVKPHLPLWEKSHLITTMEAIVKAEDQGLI